MKKLRLTANFASKYKVMTREDELILFKRILIGVKRALDMLFRSYYSSLCNFSHPIVKNTDLVEELVADIFFILWRDCKHPDIKKDHKAYLFNKTARNDPKRAKIGRNTGREFNPLMLFS
ncbi:hypothetical protein JMN32_15750 [Fulvivirga sp. 29W222]|uniref:RNA polymerase sigma-70 region 2 domain-containing protein n=1 Tax=Fulvivirga marina TaxID=2494733 RepID=A0A937G0C5_9BACT|nr:hypothetical protein [Fulvivirga marina]MBL6447773.1 hypothetical protein [Fulvivirga marina]